MDPFEAVRNRSSGPTLSLRPGTLSHVCLGLFLAQLILCWAIDLLGIPPLVNARWPGVALLVLASLSSLASLGRWLPWQNVLSSAALIAVLGTLIEILVLAGNHLVRPGQADVLPANALWPIPLVWILAVFNGRGVARLVLQPWQAQPNYGFLLLGITALLVLLLIESFVRFGGRMLPAFPAMSEHLQSGWPAARSVCVRVLGGGIVLLAATPYLINKRPVAQPADRHPLIIWGALNLWFFTVALGQKTWANGGLILLEVLGAIWLGWVSSMRNERPR